MMFYKDVTKWMFKAYILWSICADITLIAGLVWLIFY
jgi:hypothetical protein